MTQQRRYDPLLATTNTTQLPQQHKFEVHRQVNGLTVITRHYSKDAAELQQQRDGGEVVKVR